MQCLVTKDCKPFPHFNSYGRATPLTFDTTKPGGAPRKPMDSSRVLALGSKPEIALDDGIVGAYRWFLKNKLADTPRQNANIA